MNIDNLNKKRSSSLSPSDLKRIEEAFLSPTPKKQSPKKIKYSVFKYAVPLIVVSLVYFLFSRYTLIMVPKVKYIDDSLLSNRWVDSLQLLGKDTVMKFYQGVIYIPLSPGKEHRLVIDTKKPIDLTRNNLFLSLSILYKNFNVQDLKVATVVRDDKFFSNALTPWETPIAAERELGESQNSLKILVDFEKLRLPRINLSRISQIRFSFYNFREEPVSLLINDIKLTKKEEGK